MGGASVASPVTAGGTLTSCRLATSMVRWILCSIPLAAMESANCVGPNQINAYYYYDILTGNGLPVADMVTGMGVSNGAHMGGLFGLPWPEFLFHGNVPIQAEA